MTSINVMKLSRHSGLLVCDEARYWNPEWMIFYTPEKIRRIIGNDIQNEQKVVMFMGQTGSSSIGDEWIEETRRRISNEYHQIKVKKGKSPKNFMTLRQLADLTFNNITQIKHEHVNDFIVGKFGFDQDTVISGKYYIQDEEIKVSDKNVLEKARNYMDFSGAPEDVKGIFGNSQILAGYRRDEGFKIFYMTERWPVCEEVHEIFLAQGSGRDTCDLRYARYADTRRLKQRRGDLPINRTDALIALLSGVNTAMNLTAGIGGYPKIIYIDAHDNQNPENWVTEICDKRSRLAAEIVSAYDAHLLRKDITDKLIEGLIFQDVSFEKINTLLFESSTEPQTLFRFLRGYPIHD